MALRSRLKASLTEELFRWPGRRRRRGPRAGGAPEWAVLVLDRATLDIVQSCFHAYELTKESVARVDLVSSDGGGRGSDDAREPTPLHAIYFLSPVGGRPPFFEK